MNIFSNIWKKHYRRGESPNKLVEDLGPLKGKVKITQYSPGSGKIIKVTNQDNLLVNQSKSMLIRLISQGQSPYIGNIDPADMKISRMRFGNHSAGVANKLNYYRYNELSSRTNTPETVGYAGGKLSQTSIDGIAGIDIAGGVNTAGGETGFELGVGGIKKWKIPYCQEVDALDGFPINPPSHGTFQVELYNGDTLVETISFIKTDESIYTYTKIQSGNKPVEINSEVGGEIISTTDVGTTKTSLMYDYQGTGGWKFLLEEDETAETWTRLKFIFDVGKYNVINSIVPREGYNYDFTSGGESYDVLNTVTNFNSRLGGAVDWYQINDGIEYRDGDEDYVDDFSTTFSINMGDTLGNGEVTGADFIKYKEAFLFNGQDDMFSMISLNTGFEKNADSAFYISWTILAPTN